MPPTFVRALVAGVLILHGLGHLLPALPLLGFHLSKSHSSESWLLTGPLGPGVSASLGLVLNLLALGAFLVAGLSMLSLRI